jgi:hypothetical protein
VSVDCRLQRYAQVRQLELLQRAPERQADSIACEPAPGVVHMLTTDCDQELVTASKISKEKFRISRTVVLPGIKVSVQQMLDALEEVGGKVALGLIDEKVDEATNRIVASWPADYDTSRATPLGFEADISLFENVQAYFKRYVTPN